jgi:hypothetical protein
MSDAASHEWRDIGLGRRDADCQQLDAERYDGAAMLAAPFLVLRWRQCGTGPTIALAAVDPMGPIDQAPADIASHLLAH